MVSILLDILDDIFNVYSIGMEIIQPPDTLYIEYNSMDIVSRT